MALTALSGQRWQGTSDGWTLPTAYTTISDGTLNIQNDSADQDHFAWADLGSGVPTDNWVLRFKVIFDNYINVGTNPGNAVQFSFGLTAVDPPSSLTGESPTQGNWIGFQSSAHWNGSTDFRIKSYNSSAQTDTGSSRAEPLTLTRYIEIIKNGTSITENVYEDEYSTIDETLTITLATNITNMRYMYTKFFYQNIPDDNTVKIADVKWYNNQTSATTITKQFDFAGGDKATVTDVPAGSEFEQTDDYKSYQRAGVSTFTQSDDSASQAVYDDAVEIVGGKITSSAPEAILAVVGNSVTTCKVKLRKSVGNPDGTITVGVWRSSPDSGTAIHTFGTMEATSLTTSFVEYTFTSASGYTILEDDIIGVRYYGTIIRVDIAMSATISGYPQLRWNVWDATDTWTTESSAGGTYFVLEKPASWVERGTAI